jgi:hypothetical protein
MADTPIKILLLNKIKDIITGIVDVNRVFVDPSRGLREEMTEPYTNIFTNAESCIKRDLYAEKAFDIEIHTWVKEDTDDLAREEAILINATIQAAILPREAGQRAYCHYFEESGSNCSDVLYYAEGVCVAVARYDVKYRHAYGNPFKLNP